MGGSPPRARGRRRVVAVTLAIPRITPACAGTALAVVDELCREGDHPRVRGDGGRRPRGRTGARGSPPRARGRLHGLTRGRWTERDHPRVRGDGSTSGSSRRPAAGSPPRARGRQSRTIPISGGWGITPACAGTAVSGRSPTGGCRDHPRVRGDGRQVGRRHRKRRGITPACAGTALAPVVRFIVNGDHPRVRGDGRFSDLVPMPPLGSPPRARGRRRDPRRQRRRHGITPACAGTAFTTDWPASGPRDHPRVRGDG